MSIWGRWGKFALAAYLAGCVEGGAEHVAPRPPCPPAQPAAPSLPVTPQQALSSPRPSGPLQLPEPLPVEQPRQPQPSREQQEEENRRRKRQRAIDTAVTEFARLPRVEQERRYIDIEMRIRGQTPYGRGFEAAYQAVRTYNIAAVYRPRDAEGGIARRMEHPAFSCVVIMDMHQPSPLENIRSLLRAGREPDSERIPHNWLTLKYHELLHALTLEQRVQPDDELRKEHQASGREWSYHDFLEAKRGFRVTPRHRGSRAYAENRLDDITALERHGVSTAYEAFAYRVANNMSAEEILAQLRRHDYPDGQIGGISLRQVQNVVNAVDRLSALDLEDDEIADIIAKTAWSYDARYGCYTALEQAVRQRMADVRRFGMETDFRAQARQARKTRELCLVRQVVEDYLLEHR